SLRSSGYLAFRLAGADAGTEGYMDAPVHSSCAPGAHAGDRQGAARMGALPAPSPADARPCHALGDGRYDAEGYGREPMRNSRGDPVRNRAEANSLRAV